MVTLKDGASVIATQVLNGGRASFSSSTLSAATHSLSISYSGDANFNAGSSAVLRQVVNPAIKFSPAVLPAAKAGAPYNETITALNGTGFKTLTVTSFSSGGTGLTSIVTGLNSVTLSGRPSVGGIVSFDLTATDTNSSTITLHYTVPVSDYPPVLANLAFTTLEDNARNFTAADFDPAFTPAAPSLSLQSLKISTLPAHGVLSFSGHPVKAGTILTRSAIGSLVYLPAANYNGADSFKWNAGDGVNFALADATAAFTVIPVNDPPSFVKGADVSVREDSGATTIAKWATAISKGGGADETSQVLTFTILSNTNAALFTTSPALSSTGALSFSIPPLTYGHATLTVQLSDNGGTANGGNDTSPVQTFSITVGHVNHPPAVIGTGVPAQTLNVGGGSANIDLASYFTDPDTSDTLSYSVLKNTAPAVANALVTGSGLFLVPLAAGSTNVTVRVTDNATPAAHLDYVVAVTVGTASPGVTSLTRPALNSHTGRFETKVTLGNTMARTIDGMRLTVMNLPSGVQLANATDISLPVIDHIAPVQPGASVVLMLEFEGPGAFLGSYIPSIGTSEYVAPSVASAFFDPATVTEGPGQAVLVEFNTRIGDRYEVDFSDDLGATWSASPANVKAGATHVQWLDRGPPGTSSIPVLPVTRQYRIKDLH